MSDSNKKNTLINLIMLLLVFSTFRIPTTMAGFYSDDETSENNSFSATNLDLGFVSSIEDFEPSENLFPGDTTERTGFIQNLGDLPFTYSQEYEPVSGNEAFCSALNLEVTYKWEDGGSHEETKYDGPLDSFYISGATDPDLVHPNTTSGSDDHEFQYILSFPLDMGDSLAGESCVFNFRAYAWQENYAVFEAFWDTEILENNLDGADWDEEQDCEVDTEVIYDDGGNEASDFDVEFYFPYEESLVKLSVSRSYRETDGEQSEILLDEESIGTTTILSDGMENVEDTYTFTLDKGPYEIDFDALVGNSVWNWIKLEIIGCGAEENDVLINEIMWMGSTESGDDEWIELYNNTENDINISFWTIENAGSGDLTIPEESVIPSNGYFLISNYASDHEDSALSDANVNVNFVTEDLDLDNGGEELTLKDVLENNIDSTSNGSWAAGIDSEHKKSMERNDDPSSGWHTCTDSVCNDTNYWDSEGNNYGTPRSENHSEGDGSSENKESTEDISALESSPESTESTTERDVADDKNNDVAECADEETQNEEQNSENTPQEAVLNDEEETVSNENQEEETNEN